MDIKSILLSFLSKNFVPENFVYSIFNLSMLCIHYKYSIPHQITVNFPQAGSSPVSSISGFSVGSGRVDEANDDFKVSNLRAIQLIVNNLKC